MAELNRVSGIDVDQDMSYQRREWRAQKVAWVLFGAFLLAALVGFLGQGPLAKRSIGEPGSALSLEYMQIDRYQAPTQMTFTLDPSVADQGLLRLSFSAEFVKRIELERFIPQPEYVEVGADEVTYALRVTEATEAVKAYLDFEHQQPGLAKGWVRLADGSSLQFSVFVFP